ncbi:MAG: polyprenyl synthetase family protein [Planctomycetaceae bacterium]|nr:polyprenyl synthetase family protein [Planctomycetaceae bacterium]
MPTTTTTPSRPELLSALYAPIAAELAEVEHRLKTELRSDYPFVDELVRYGCLLGGKRLRPALLLLSAKAAGNRVTREHLTLATVVEMIHTATLVHDDVLDEAHIRRHLATVNARWDNEASVLLGDFLFTHAFYLASTLDSVQGCRLIGRATNIVCEGELRQKGSRGNFALTETEYLEIIEAKTAELTAVSCWLGALFAGAGDELVEQLDGFGRDLGIAFQIADDLLDVQGQEQAMGKSLGTDLAKQKPTLPIIRALELASPADRAALLEILTDREGEAPAGPRTRALAPYLQRYDALDYAKSRGQAFAHRARQRLELLSASPARDVLASMTEFVMSRNT